MDIAGQVGSLNKSLGQLDREIAKLQTDFLAGNLNLQGIQALKNGTLTTMRRGIEALHQNFESGAIPRSLGLTGKSFMRLYNFLNGYVINSFGRKDLNEAAYELLPKDSSDCTYDIKELKAALKSLCLRADKASDPLFGPSGYYYNDEPDKLNQFFGQLRQMLRGKLDTVLKKIDELKPIAPKRNWNRSSGVLAEVMGQAGRVRV